VLKQWGVELDVGGRSPRDLADRCEKALGQFVLSKRTVRALSASLTQEYAAFRPRALSGEPVADLFLEAVYAPLRRWGSRSRYDG
jgi:hypothetical protein